MSSILIRLHGYNFYKITQNINFRALERIIRQLGNSRSINISVHMYEHAIKERIDEVIKNKIYAMAETQDRIEAKFSKENDKTGTQGIRPYQAITRWTEFLNKKRYR